MERLTYDFCVGDKHCWQVKGADNLECREVCRNQGENGCTDCPIAKAFDRLAAYEDTGLEPEAVEHLKLASMGKAIAEIKEFEGVPIDRLRELAQAKKKGRLVVLSEPMKPMVYKPNDTDVYCPSCGESLSGGWPLSDADDLRKLCQCPNCGQSIDDTRCEAAEAALEERSGDKNNA